MKHEKQLSTVREIYRTSRERVSEILKALHPVKSDTKTYSCIEKDYDRVQNLLNSVVGSQRFESENDYRAVLDFVGTWSLYALEKTYIEANSQSFPTPLFVVKKGIEVLHLLLHRDLRRRNLTNSETQLYNEFVRLTQNLPAPKRARLAQDDIDAIAESEQKKQNRQVK